MPTTEDIDSVLAEIDEAHKEVSRIREAMRAHRVTHPEAETPGLEAALSYWESLKEEAEQDSSGLLDALKRLFRLGD